VLIAPQQHALHFFDGATGVRLPDTTA